MRLCPGVELCVRAGCRLKVCVVILSGMRAGNLFPGWFGPKSHNSSELGGLSWVNINGGETFTVLSSQLNSISWEAVSLSSVSFSSPFW